MPHDFAYELLDFGDGRKLERFGDIVIDRPSRAADGHSRQLGSVEWGCANWRFDINPKGRDGRWTPSQYRSAPEKWEVMVPFGVMQLQCRPTGQIGLFPEQLASWMWISQHTGRLAGEPLLNLFAYTGASSLAAARVGAAVVHVDAAKNIVAQARANARHCGLESAPIRWITDDVQKFVGREIRRGRRYRAILLDPPSYGHGPRGEAWQLDHHLEPLIEQLAQLLAPGAFLFLLTCHTPGFEKAQLDKICRPIWKRGQRGTRVHHQPLTLIDPQGRALPSGHGLQIESESNG